MPEAEMRLHVPEPAARPGEDPDFSFLAVPPVDEANRPPIDARAEDTYHLATTMIRVLDDDAIPAPCRGLGILTGFTRSQLAPSHSQLSPKNVPCSQPPNITARPRRASNSIAKPLRSGGWAAVVRCAHAEPSHSQVSKTQFPPGVNTPPRSNVRRRTES